MSNAAMIHVDNAIIMAAGTASRFAPLSYERPKALIEVRGEVLIERQIRQLLEAGVLEIMVVVGYQREQFAYLQDRYGVRLIDNDEYLTRNNNGSIYAARDYLRNSYICSADNYFVENPFHAEEDGAFYAAVYADGETNEWCMEENADGYIDRVTIGGSHQWYMLGHAFWDSAFSERFLTILEVQYDQPQTRDLLWESIYVQHLDTLHMRIRRYPAGEIYEFDTLDELRQFDPSYIEDTRSAILRDVAARLHCKERDIVHIRQYRTRNNAASGFTCKVNGRGYRYDYADGRLWEEGE